MIILTAILLYLLFVVMVIRFLRAHKEQDDFDN